MKEILTKIYNSKSVRLPQKARKIKLIHLLTVPDEEREKKSIESLSKLSRFGIDYIQNINEPCTELPPKETCRHPDRLGMDAGFYIRTPGNYGCYLAHKEAALEGFDSDLDFLIVCECDCVMVVEPEVFYAELMKVCDTLEKKEKDIVYVDLGSDNDPNGICLDEDGNKILEYWERDHGSNLKETVDDSLSIADRTLGTECILYQKSSIKTVKEKFLNEKWDGMDMWKQQVYVDHRKAYSKVPLAAQLRGDSYRTLLDITNQERAERADGTRQEPNIKISYHSGVTCEISGKKSDLKYTVKFIDIKNSYTESFLCHKDSISVNHWAAPFRKWYTKWRITVTEEVSQKEIFSEEFNLKDEKVLISFDSSSLGDNIAWIPYVEEFRKKHDCKVSCSTFFNDLFEKEYPEIKFIPVGSSLENMYASYEIGWFDNWDNRERNPNDLRTIPLQQTASDILGLNVKNSRPWPEHKEIKTKINIESSDRPIKEKYVCISTSSTAGCKHWQNPTGWQKTVDYLNTLGYKVVVIQKEPLDYMDLDGLENVIHPDTKNIQEAITWLCNCDFFIGISSGISWLAWALNKKVILISGFTDTFHEFSTPYRVINKNVCNSCWQNTNFLFDKGDWNWCPIHKNTDRQFECSKTITFDIVKKEINKIKPLKIGLQILAYNCKEAFPRLIEPWAKLKKEYNFDFWVNSRQFRIYEEMGSEDVNAETLKMLKNDYSELIDCLSVPEKTLSDHETRTLCLEYFEKKDVDLIWLLDADEFYTEEEIRNVIEYVQENPQYDWYSIRFKNYIGDGNKWDDFNPMRIVWRKRYGGMRNYYWDGHFCYKNGTEYKSHPNIAIPKKIAFPDHFTWTNEMNTTGPKHIKEKIEYQKRYYSDGCGYEWNEESQTVEENKSHKPEESKD